MSKYNKYVSVLSLTKMVGTSWTREKNYENRKQCHCFVEILIIFNIRFYFIVITNFTYRIIMGNI